MKNRFEKRNQKGYYAISILNGLLVCLFLLQFFIQKEVTFTGSASPINWKVVLLFMFLMISILIQAVLYHLSKQKLREEITVQTELFQNQERYYELLLSREEKTKQFRHDWQNQLICLKELLKEESYLQCQEYIEKYMENTEEIQYVYHTGNKILDIALNDEIRKKDILVRWNGIVPENMEMTDIDICVLFSNLFRNAMAAARQTDQPWFYVNVKSEGSYLIFIMENAMVCEKGKKMVPETGIGIINIHKILKKYHGTIRYEVKTDRMIVKMILPKIFCFNENEI